MSFHFEDPVWRANYDAFKEEMRVGLRVDGKRLTPAVTAQVARFSARRQQHPHRYRLSLLIHRLALRVWHP